jgi:tripartite-type tricarboxylate transporter receptor subunit TctC
MVEEFVKQGMTPVAREPGDFAKLLVAELDRWAQVIQAAGIKPE